MCVFARGWACEQIDSTLELGIITTPLATGCGVVANKTAHYIYRMAARRGSAAVLVNICLLSSKGDKARASESGMNFV